MDILTGAIWIVILLIILSSSSLLFLLLCKIGKSIDGIYSCRDNGDYSDSGYDDGEESSFFCSWKEDTDE